MPGGSLGVRFPVSARLFLFPEIVVVVPYDLEGGGLEVPLVQGGIALQWDSQRASKSVQPPP